MPRRTRLGILQAISNAPGSECILESTANGIGNFFHRTWRDAEMGRNEFIAVFVPWYWLEEYRKRAGGRFRVGRKRACLCGALRARRRPDGMAPRQDRGTQRPRSVQAGISRTAAEAFQMSGHDSYIPPALVARARKAACEASGPLVIGFDPAWMGGDRHAMAWRRGRRVIKWRAGLISTPCNRPVGSSR